MSRATFKCDCGEIKEVNFNAGKKPESPVCDKCGKVMKRVFKSVDAGMSVPDEILYANNMLVHQAK